LKEVKQGKLVRDDLSLEELLQNLNNNE
jgi:hypothetical protein